MVRPVSGFPLRQRFEGWRGLFFRRRSLCGFHFSRQARIAVARAGRLHNLGLNLLRTERLLCRTHAVKLEVARQYMNLLRVTVCVALTASLQGCWFVFIPGSVIDKVSDTFSGAEGSNCVGQSAKVGDKIRSPNGDVGTIKSLSGTSVRCKEPQFPIRALLVLSNNNAYSTRFRSPIPRQNDHRFQRISIADSTANRSLIL